MPIKPENRDRYPADWAQIRARILERARHRCEECGVENHAWGWRDRVGQFQSVNPEPLRDAGHEKPPFTLACHPDGYRQGRLLHVIEIVLTVAHLDHNPENCADHNLRALCQRCHLAHDQEHHRREAAKARLDTRTLNLFGGSPNAEPRTPNDSGR